MKELKSAVFLLLVCCYAAAGQEVDKTAIEERLRSLRNSLSLFSPKDNTVKAQLNECRQIINEAIINIDSRDGKYTAGYAESIGGLQQLATSLPGSDTSGQKIAVRTIYKSLLLKFRYPSHGVANLAYAQAVTVTVITRDRSILRVNYTPSGYRIDYQHPDHQFGRLTPAHEEMAPGIYEMWLTQDGKPVVIKRVQIEIDPDKADNTVEF